uniref:Wzz/FepE/Etk N-terminal domain-containing protein n=1 Tax=Pedobacter schmidteae TaxID=2201271 RepID=UPI000EB2EF74|nr:Wzz/FepE/Etk N-terminal domain-containing protein [Pedobacter schmidteae]
MTENQKAEAMKESDDISIKDFILGIKEWLSYLFSKGIFVLVFVIVGGIFGLIYSYFKKPVYTATTTFVLEEGGASNPLGNLGGLASMVGLDVGGGGGLFMGDNILELYKSRAMIQQALLAKRMVDGKKQLLLDRFVDFNDLKEKWKETKWNKADFSDIARFGVIQDSILREIVKDVNKNYLKVGKLDKKSSIIKVDVSSEDQAFAKAFADEIVSSVNRFYIETKTKKALQNVNILQHKTDSVRRVMNGAIGTAAAIVDATPNLNPARQAQRIAPVQKSQFSAETNKAVLGELIKNLELSKITLLKETPLIQVVDQPILPLEVERVGKGKGIFLGGILGGFLTIVALIIKRIFKKILNG